MPNRLKAIAAGAGAAVRVALPAASLLAQQGDRGGTIDSCGWWMHPTAPDIGVDVIEATRGFTACGPETLDIGEDTVRIPQAEGITWFFGETSRGDGWEVVLPSGTSIFFDGERKEAVVQHPRGADADRPLVDEILATAPGHQRRDVFE